QKRQTRASSSRPHDGQIRPPRDRRSSPLCSPLVTIRYPAPLVRTAIASSCRCICLPCQYPGGTSSTVVVVARQPPPGTPDPQLDQNTSEIRRPTPPTTIRMTPTVLMPLPDTAPPTTHATT